MARNRMKIYARFLEFLCLFVCIPIVVMLFFIKWFFSDIVPVSLRNFFLNFSFANIDILSPWLLLQSQPSTLVRLLAAAVDGISIGLFIWGLISFVRLLRCYGRGELFSNKTVALCVKMSRIAFAWAVYNLFKGTLLSFISTVGNPPGQRIISISVSSDDFFHIFVVGLFLVLTSLMREAYKIKKEQDLTV